MTTNKYKLVDVFPYCAYIMVVLAVGYSIVGRVYSVGVRSVRAKDYESRYLPCSDMKPPNEF